MQVGVALPELADVPPAAGPPPVEPLVTWARRAEALGLASAWVFDHLVLELVPGDPASRRPCLDPMVVLALLARRTSRLRLGVLAVCEPLRPPAVLAKALATLDAIAGRRLDVVLGAGWQAADFEAVGMALPPGRVRLERLAETIDVVRPLLAGGPVTYLGRHHKVHAATNRPPMARPVRLAVGGRGDRLLELVAARADGWNTAWVWTPETYAERLDVLAAACRRSGRDPATVDRTLGLSALVGWDDADLARRWDATVRASRGRLARTDLATWRLGRLVGTVDEVARQLAGWAELGVAEVVAGLGHQPFAGTDVDDLEPLAAAADAAGAERKPSSDPVNLRCRRRPRTGRSTAP